MEPRRDFAAEPESIAPIALSAPMKSRVDARLRAEAARFALRFACDHCAHFDQDRTRCAHGYPPAPREGALEEPELAFCKEFELG